MTGRRDQILAHLRSHGNVLVADLAVSLDTSEITIRRDLKLLEAEGVVRRIHGGAVLVPNRTYEPTFLEKSRQLMDEKRRIGAAAAKLVNDGDAIILGPGTTTMEVARQLHGRRNLTVVTSAVNVAAQLAGEPEIEVIVTGGNLRGTTYALVGSLAEENLRRLHATTLFLGGNGLTVSNGLTTPDLTVAATDRALVDVAERVIVTVDHSKIGRATLCQTAPIDRIDVLVTDTGLPAEQRRAFAAAGVEVILA
ncbi:MAG: DeoR/GlpR transcriptional regulator [Chloroflexi bacterium]|nr:DeoR/GlpR transcriptional regulator [Chloroflexota bacterium]